jgi:hypothetical protein
VGLELLQSLWRIINESETGCLSTTELSPQTEDVDLFLVCFIHLSEFATEFFFGDVCSARVEDVTVKLSEHFALFDHSYSDGDELLREVPFLTYMTICFLLRRGLRRNLRVRNVTGASAIFDSAQAIPACCGVSFLQIPSRTSPNLRVLLRLICAWTRLGALSDRMFRLQEFDIINFLVVVNGAKRDDW